AYDGKVGWLSIPARVHLMNEQEAAGARMDADLTFASDVKRLYAKFEARQGERVGVAETWEVVGRNEGQPPLRLFFDKRSGLLVRLVRYAESPMGLMPTQIDYADYRGVDGTKVAFRWTVARPGNRFTVQLERLQQNVPVDDAKFVAPASP